MDPLLLSPNPVLVITVRVRVIDAADSPEPDVLNPTADFALAEVSLHAGDTTASAVSAVAVSVAAVRTSATFDVSVGVLLLMLHLLLLRLLLLLLFPMSLLMLYLLFAIPVDVATVCASAVAVPVGFAAASADFASVVPASAGDVPIIPAPPPPDSRCYYVSLSPSAVLIASASVAFIPVSLFLLFYC